MGLFDKLKKILTKSSDTDIKVYDEGLSKTRKNFFDKLNILNTKYNRLTEDYFEELESILVMADIGVNTVMEFMDRLRSRVKKENITDTSILTEIIIDELFIIYVDEGIISSKINYSESGPTVILFVGVNGVGKTTTIAKIAHQMINDGKKVLLIAGDTFRAGAVEQIIEWGSRVGAIVVSGKEEADPSSVIYDGLKVAIDDDYDCVLIDTAGRLQNKVNLMNELSKINKVISTFISDAPHETLLVIDATTGQNGISQAKAFKEITNVTGIVLTKLDGTAKGGIVLAIKESVNIPVKYIGLGEKVDDLRPFDIEKYIYGLFKGMNE
jgi:fused signal recognition particle receptor